MFLKTNYFYKNPSDNIIQKEEISFIENGKTDVEHISSTLTKEVSNIGKSKIMEKYNLNSDSKDNSKYTYKIYDNNELYEEFDGKLIHKYKEEIKESLKIKTVSDYSTDKSEIEKVAEIKYYSKTDNEEFKASDIDKIADQYFIDFINRVYMNIDGSLYKIIDLLRNTGKSIFRDSTKVIYKVDNVSGVYTYSFKTKEDIEIFSCIADKQTNIPIELHLVFTKKDNTSNPFSQMSEISIEKVEDGYEYIARDVDVSIDSPLQYNITTYRGVAEVTTSIAKDEEQPLYKYSSLRSIYVFSMYEMLINNYISKILDCKDGVVTLEFSEYKNDILKEKYIDTVKPVDNEYDFIYTPVTNYVKCGNYKLLHRDFVTTGLNCESVDSYTDNEFSVVKSTYKSGRVGKMIIPTKYHYYINYHTADGNIKCYTDLENATYNETKNNNEVTEVRSAEFNYNEEGVSDIIERINDLITEIDLRMKEE